VRARQYGIGLSGNIVHQLSRRTAQSRPAVGVVGSSSNTLSVLRADVVVTEATVGDPNEVQKRMAIIDELPALEPAPEAKELTDAFLASGVIPPKAFRDAAHVAIATVHQVEYLLTWNCKHIANGQIIRKLSQVCNRFGYKIPLICTPEELMGE
jgi:hypothetical protein